MKKVLIPVDGSESSLRAVRHLIEMVRCREPVEVFLLNVEEAQDSWEVRRFLTAEEIARIQQGEGEDALSAARALLDEAGVAYSHQVAIGPIAETIAKFAHDQGIDNIVMGARGHGAIANLLLGSVVTKVIHLASMPVTVVK